MIINFIIRLVIATAGIILMDQLGFWVWLVAHPFWNFQGALIGIVVGSAILLVCNLLFKNRSGNRVVGLGLFIVLAIVAAGIAIYGKTGFADSFGEDRTAGMFWYYGYLAITTASFLTLFQLTGFVAPKKAT